MREKWGHGCPHLLEYSTGETQGGQCMPWLGTRGSPCPSGYSLGGLQFWGTHQNHPLVQQGGQGAPSREQGAPGGPCQPFPGGRNRICGLREQRRGVWTLPLRAKGLTLNCQGLTLGEASGTKSLRPQLADAICFILCVWALSLTSGLRGTSHSDWRGRVKKGLGSVLW